MLSHVFRLARPAARLSVWSKPTTTTSSRAFTVSTARKSGHPAPQLLGEGGKSGEVPTDINQSTGLERMQTMGYLEGVEVFDSQPLDSSRIGTLDHPVLVYSLDVERVMGCTGSPQDSHDIRWYTIHKDKLLRCGECGSVYKLDYHGPEEGEHGHDHH
ncbi:COX5B-domain-containing protein [Thelephora terrestris]|uniref:COX5B-domain-containing protein n=1 Tax=Thelephora terrestris TaxID=56493 RepID=A0A9P6LAH0_9AGAM|nr:COX5B-domain-containing protein [Thelephora terrestris]